MRIVIAVDLADSVELYKTLAPMAQHEASGRNCLYFSVLGSIATTPANAKRIGDSLAFLCMESYQQQQLIEQKITMDGYQNHLP